MWGRVAKIASGLALLAGLAGAVRAADELQSKDYGWCVITCPKVVTTAVPFEVKVDLKGLKGPTKLNIDLHCRKKDGSYGGFFAWGGGSKDVDKDGPQITTFTINSFKDDLGTVNALAVLSPDGQWGSMTTNAVGPDMELKATEVFLKTVRPKDCTFKKSWICIEPPDPSKAIRAGEEFEVRIKYYLDPAENWGDGTKLFLLTHGPWIDCPDGKYTKNRGHIGYPGLNGAVVQVEPGKGEQVLKFKASSVHKYNGLLLVAHYQGGDGRDWPWETRASGPHFIFEDKYYQLSNGKPGGLFTYDEPVTLQILFKDGAVRGESKTLKYKIFNTKGAEIGSGEQPFTVGGKDESVAFVPEIRERGTFVVEAEVAGWGSRDVVFARIPDVMKSTAGGKTPFGATLLNSDAECQIARMLGFTTCRQFLDWRFVQPARDTWNFEAWDRILATNRKYGIEPWLCLHAPPNWVQRSSVANIGYEPFPFDDADLRNSVTVMTGRWKDLIMGWEWLNEIVPGDKSPSPAEDYTRFCAVATEAARKIKPSLHMIMAGGLWPRTFRNDCLKDGVGAYVDELPIHYGDMGGILDARDDLDAVNDRQVAVTDDETSCGFTTWEMPAREWLQIKAQSQWVLNQWPDELVAGAARVTCFAGWADPCGNFAYILDEHTPRPMAATIAVLATKLTGAKPIGKFYLPEHGVFHLFEKDGKAVLLASSSTTNSTKIDLNVGSESLVVTDYQGNETALRAPGGNLSLELEPMKVFIEGGKLDVLKSYCAAAVGDGRRGAEFPKMTIVKGATSKVPIAVRNVFDRPLAGTVAITVPAGWPPSAPVKFEVQPGHVELLDLPLAPPATVAAGEFSIGAVFTFMDAGIPAVAKPFGVSVITREMVGNLLKNGGFEQADRSATEPSGWVMGSKVSSRQPSGGGLGLGASVLKFEKAPKYEYIAQEIAPPPGQTYLYTAWVWNQDMKACSNIEMKKSDGTKQVLYAPSVFLSGNASSSWHLYSSMTETPPNLQSIAFVPTVIGSGWSLYDNLRVTIFEGSPYAAEAHKAKAPLRLDGRLDGWDLSCPIPLLCENQLSLVNKAYAWTPGNLSGVAYLMWDDQALYAAIEVVDDVHCAKTTGEQTLEGDSMALAIHPANRAPGKDDKAFVYYLSSASPGGGSGASTLYRPPSHSGGLSSGQLCKDSSMYELLIKTEGNKTIYQLRMPWSELGGIAPAFGSKFGLSLLLNDNDGADKAATMSWGDGLIPGWMPSKFGICTLVEE